MFVSEGVGIQDKKPLPIYRIRSSLVYNIKGTEAVQCTRKGELTKVEHESLKGGQILGKRVPKLPALLMHSYGDLLVNSCCIYLARIKSHRERKVQCGASVRAVADEHVLRY